MTNPAPDNYFFYESGKAGPPGHAKTRLGGAINTLTHISNIY